METPKAYDLPTLEAKAKALGISEGKDGLLKAVDLVADFLISSAKLSTEGTIGHFDDFGIAGVEFLQKLAHDKLK